MEVQTRKWFRRWLSIALSAAVLVGCGGGADDSPAPAQASAAPAAASPVVKKETVQGYVLSTAVWTQSQIPVCWINPSAWDAVERGWVQAAVARTWARNSQVSFVGWGLCPAVNQGNAVRISIADAGPYTGMLGQGVQLLDVGVSLNFTFSTWSQSCAYAADWRRQCIEGGAVHEFGHVLGFAHEQNRPDTPTWLCQDAPQGANGDTMIGAWDLDSVMNYCNPLDDNYGQLSPTDIAMLQTYYKAPIKDSDFTFDAAFYLDTNPDLKAAFGNDQQAALNHWLTIGLKEGRRASREFDVVYYINAYPDLRQAFGTDYTAARDHWVASGINEGRRGSREVDAAYYLYRYYDLQAAFGTNYRAALNHWVSSGLTEQRRASWDFSVKNYFWRYLDLRLAFRYTDSYDTYVNDPVLGFNHWVVQGRNEGRDGS